MGLTQLRNDEKMAAFVWYSVISGGIRQPSGKAWGPKFDKDTHTQIHTQTRTRVLIESRSSLLDATKNNFALRICFKP